MKNYKLGFAPKGFISFLLIMLPNIIWMVAPPLNDPLAGNSSAYPAIDIVMDICRWLIIALLCVAINKAGADKKHGGTLAKISVVCLIGYYIMWILYYSGNANPWIFMGLAVFPSVYFVVVGLWLKNYPAVIPSVVFGALHIFTTCTNFFNV